MKVSVIIPYYNSKSTIIRALISIMSQTVSPSEIILVNDNSPDWTDVESSILNLKIEHLKIIHHEVNRNGSAARNTGIHSAIGDLILFLDADDYWLNTHIELNITTLKEREIYPPFIIFSSAYLFNSKGISRLNQEKEFYKVPNISEYIFVSGKTASCITFCISKDVFGNLLFDESLKRYQDITFLLKANSLSIPIYQIPVATAVIDWTRNSLFNLSKSKGFNYDFLVFYFNNYRSLFTLPSLNKLLIRDYIPMICYLRNLNLLLLIYKFVNWKSISIIFYFKYSFYFLVGIKDKIVK